jgi:hypothetical protein
MDPVLMMNYLHKNSSSKAVNLSLAAVAALLLSLTMLSPTRFQLVFGLPHPILQLCGQLILARTSLV